MHINDQKYKKLLNSIPGAFYRIKNDSNLTIDFVSDGFWKLIKYTPREFHSLFDRSFLAIFKKEEKKKFLDMLRSITNNNTDFVIEHELNVSSHEETWVKNNGIAISKYGEIEYFEGVLTDITTYKKQYKELKKLNKKSEIISQAIDNTIVIHKNGIIKEINNNVENMFGYSKEECKNNNIFIFFKKIDWDFIYERFRAKHNGSLEMLLKKKDGSQFWAKLNINTIECIDEENVIITTIQDIDIYKRKIDELRELTESLNHDNMSFENIIENRTDKINNMLLNLKKEINEQEEVQNKLIDFENIINMAFKTAKIALWEWNIKEDLIIYHSNPESATSYSEINISHSFSDFKKLIYPEDISNLEEALSRHKDKSDDYVSIDYRINDKDGNWKWIRSIGNIALRDEFDNPLLAYGIHADIDVYKKNEIDIANTTKELKIQLQELDSFSHSVSHDLKSPLNIILNYSELLLQEDIECSSEERSMYLDFIYKNSIRMKELIEDLIKLSRLNYYNLDIRVFNISSLIREIFELIKTEDPSRNIHLKCEDNVFVKGDSELLRLVVENILKNSWKFTSKRSKALIEFYSKEIIKGDCQEVIYCFKDNGIGFNKDESENLFKEFSRLHKESEFKGTGVGLAIVRRVIEKHNGKVWADSVEGEGAEFFFKLKPDC